MCLDIHGLMKPVLTYVSVSQLPYKELTKSSERYNTHKITKSTTEYKIIPEYLIVILQ